MKRLAWIASGSALVALGSCAFTVPLPDDDAGHRPAATSAAGPLGVPVADDGAARARPPALETFTGSASYYADKFEGRRTASGARFRQAEMWAAHRTLPFGTRLRVTNLENGREVEVEVVDRGPFIRGRVLDLSKAAARALGYVRAGHTKVRVEVLERP